MNDISKRFLWVSVYAVAMTLLEAVAGGSNVGPMGYLLLECGTFGTTCG